jgi:Nif-specific regulatory protein
MLEGIASGALLEATKVITRSLDLRETLQAVAQQAAGVTRAEASSVLLMDARKGKLIFKAAFGQKGDELLEREFDAELGIAGQVARSGQSRRINNCESEENFFKGFDSQLQFVTRNMICSPMIYQGKVVGVIEVLNSAGREGFTGDDEELLAIFANLAAIGMVNAERYEGLKRQNESLKLSEKGAEHIVGSQRSLNAVMELVGKVAHTNATVLVLGETGTGKELIARTIHQQSSRAEAPFVAINCGALPEGLLESELFGHEMGAFTGAIGQKLGRFELAEGGTIFLDEVGELSPAIQVKLLRVLQEREFVRVGGVKTIAADVRVIAATNRDLQQMMSEGEFREDLYYRLNVFPVQLPPLRERRDDIPELVNYQVKRVATELKVPVCGVSDEAVRLLVEYRWPGNIRELQNVIERAVLLSSGREISVADLPKEITGQPATLSAQPEAAALTLPEHEKFLIVRCLEKNHWNQSETARQLGISRDHLRYRIKKYDLRK